MRKKKKKRGLKYQVIKLPAENIYFLMWRPLKRRYAWDHSRPFVKYLSIEDKWSYKIEKAQIFKTKKAADEQLVKTLFLEKL